MSLYDALRAAGLDLQRAHRLDAYARAAGDDVTDGFVRTLLGDREGVEHLRTSLAADVDALTAGLALLEAGRAGAGANAHDAVSYLRPPAATRSPRQRPLPMR